MDSWIVGAPPPKASGPPVYDILAPQPGETFDVVLLHTHILHVEGLWTADPVTRRQSCVPYRPFDPWPPKELKPRRQWHGFIGAGDLAKRKRFILRLGPDSAGDLVRLARPVTGLRGLAMEMRRAGGKGGLRLAYFPHDCPLAKVPDEFRMGPSISLVMGGHHIDEGGLMTPSEIAAEFGEPAAEGGAQ